MIAEFERILAINSSIKDTFQANFAQMVGGIIEIARNKKVKNQEEMNTFLSTLDAKDDDGKLQEQSAGKT